MAKLNIGETKGDLFKVEPEKLTLITDKNNALYDPRMELPLDENFVLNIMSIGVLEPILIRKNGDKIEVVAGRQRTRAAIEANKRLKLQGCEPLKIPAILKTGDEKEMLGILVSENEMRKDDDIFIKGEKARKLSNYGYTESEIANRFGVARQTVSNWLKADSLTEEVKKAVNSGELKVTAAVQLADLSNENQIEKLEEVRNLDVKPTAVTIKNVLNGITTPKMRTKKEINEKLKNTQDEVIKNTLKWVLGECDD